MWLSKLLIRLLEIATRNTYRARYLRELCPCPTAWLSITQSCFQTEAGIWSISPAFFIASLNLALKMSASGFVWTKRSCREGSQLSFFSDIAPPGITRCRWGWNWRFPPQVWRTARYPILEEPIKRVRRTCHSADGCKSLTMSIGQKVSETPRA